MLVKNAGAQRLLQPTSNIQNPTSAFLSCLFEQRQADLLRQHHFLGDLKLADLFVRGDVVHQIQHEIFEDHPQTRAPTFRSIAKAAMASSASSLNLRRTFSNSN